MIWEIKEVNKDLEQKLSKELGISEILSRILINRGITDKKTAEKFLYPSLSNLADPFLIPGMEKAVARIKRAKERKEKILIYGDYDVDGITSIVLILSFLRQSGLNVDFYIPNRLTEGYGLHKEALQLAKRQGISLVITVDCGITNREESLFAKELGIDIIITDHHLPEEENEPEACAIVDPMAGECPEELKYLAGVGVAYKLTQALSDSMHPTEQASSSKQHLDLVALGTIADLVPLLGENRILVKEGLKQVKESRKEGIKALLQVSGLVDKELSAHHVGFILGPRLNASGRVTSANKAVDLFLTESPSEATSLAQLLDEENQIRQKIGKKMFQEALLETEREKLDANYAIVLAREGWHPGVAGIVASKITERFHRPTIILCSEKGIMKGSGRSIPDFHLFAAIKKCKDLLLSYGGHKLAVGLTLKKDNLSEFQKRLEEEARASLSKRNLEEKINIDSILSLTEIAPPLLRELDALFPFGRGNPRPLFASSNVRIGKFIRKKNKNLFCWLEEKGKYLEAAGFGMAEKIKISPGFPVDVAYSLRINDWNGIRRIQLILKDIKPATTDPKGHSCGSRNPEK